MRCEKGHDQEKRNIGETMHERDAEDRSSPKHDIAEPNADGEDKQNVDDRKVADVQHGKEHRDVENSPGGSEQGYCE